jgi:hypothetical protein
MGLVGGPAREDALTEKRRVRYVKLCLKGLVAVARSVDWFGITSLFGAPGDPTVGPSRSSPGFDG